MIRTGPVTAREVRDLMAIGLKSEAELHPDYEQAENEKAASAAIHQHRESDDGGRILRSVGKDRASGDGREARSGSLRTEGDADNRGSDQDHSQVECAVTSVPSAARTADSQPLSEEVAIACDGWGHVWDEVSRRFFKKS
jgi:hypothetical protein